MLELRVINRLLYNNSSSIQMIWLLSFSKILSIICRVETKWLVVSSKPVKYCSYSRTKTKTVVTIFRWLLLSFCRSHWVTTTCGTTAPPQVVAAGTSSTSVASCLTIFQTASSRNCSRQLTPAPWSTKPPTMCRKYWWQWLITTTIKWFKILSPSKFNYRASQKTSWTPKLRLKESLTGICSGSSPSSASVKTLRGHLTKRTRTRLKMVSWKVRTSTQFRFSKKNFRKMLISSKWWTRTKTKRP